MSPVPLRLARQCSAAVWPPATARGPFEQSRVSALLAASRIDALYQANQLDAAASLFEQTQSAIADCGLADFIALAYLSMLRIQDARARPAQAEELLRELRRIARAAQLPRLLVLLEWERVRRLLLRGELLRAAEIAALIAPAASSAEQSACLQLGSELDSAAIGHIRLLIHQGRMQPALLLIAQEQRAAETQGSLRQRIRLHLLDALAQHRSGNHALARRSLQRAVQMAEMSRLQRPLLEEGEMLIELLKQELRDLQTVGERGAADSRIVRFIETTLAAAGRTAVRLLPAKGSALIEPLTERELDVLIHLTHGASNRTIADEIHIGENTVKYHLKNVFAKLQVRSRLEAICKARQLGLL